MSLSLSEDSALLNLPLHLLVALITLFWIVLDKNAIAAFEISKWHLHGTARDMGIYWEWFLQSVLRAALLISCVVGGAAVSVLMLQQNAWGLGWAARTSLFAVMLACSIALFAMPHVAAHIRLRRFLYQKATELIRLASMLSTDDGICRRLESVSQGTEAFGGVDGWSAWHPRHEEWSEESFWSGLVLVVYLNRDGETSLIFPVDFGHFLAWNLPDGSVTPGELMPIRPRCIATEVRELQGLNGWSVVRADLCIEDVAA